MRPAFLVLSVAAVCTMGCDDVRKLGGPATVRIPVPDDMKDRGLLGLSIDWQGDDASQLVVTGVLPGSTPDHAGIESGDTIVQINDVQINSIDDLPILKPDQIAKLTVLRGDLIMAFDVRLMSYVEVVQLQMLQETSNPSGQEKDEDR